MPTLVKALKTKEFRKKFLFTVFVVAVVRLGCQCPIPGIDGAQVSAYLKSILGDSFSLMNSFTGGSFLSMSIFALNVTPIYYRVHYHAAVNDCDSGIGRDAS